MRNYVVAMWSCSYVFNIPVKCDNIHTVYAEHTFTQVLYEASASD